MLILWDAFRLLGGRCICPETVAVDCLSFWSFSSDISEMPSHCGYSTLLVFMDSYAY